MASLEEDVRSHAAYDLVDLRTRLLNGAVELTPTELVDAAIVGTVNEIEKQFQLKAIGVCESNGDPHYCSGIATYYWSVVSDDMSKEGV